VSFLARYHVHLAPLESTIYSRPQSRNGCVMCAPARDRLSNPTTSTWSSWQGAPTGFLIRFLRAEFGRIHSLFNAIRSNSFSELAASNCADWETNGQPAGLFDNHTGMNGPCDRVISAFWFWMRTGIRFEPLRPFAEESVQIFAPPSSSKPALGLTNFSFLAIPA
jgi:hypothetical protein